MNVGPVVVVVVVSVIMAARGELHQKPQAHPFASPLNYPPDYCPQLADDDQFDYIVVGAGPAGAPVARRLAEDPQTRVLLLEAGADPKKESDIPSERAASEDTIWNIKTEPGNQCLGYPNETCQYLFAKFLGGCSVVNLMMYIRGNPLDYDEWESEGNPGWGWKNMKKYFLKLENLQDPLKRLHVRSSDHHVGGPFTTAPSADDPQTYSFTKDFAKALSNQGVKENNDPNGQSQVGYGTTTMLLDEGGYRENVAKAYLLNIPENMKICKYSIVKRVTLSDEKAVTGLEFTYNGTQNKVVKARKEYILSGGPISSPQILERSGIGRRDVLEKAGVEVVHELEGVGENLQEQYANSGCAFLLTLDNASPRNPLSTAITSFTIFLNMTDFNNEIPDLQWFFYPFSPVYMKFKPEITEQYQTLLQQPRAFIFMAGSALLRQTNPGYVHIKGMDPTESPSFQPNVFTSEYESRTYGKGCRLIRRAMNDSLLSRFKPTPIILNECKQHPLNSDEEIMCHAKQVAFPSHHLAGTTRMGAASDKKAVVDGELRVHGVQNLRVVDLGVMPRVPRGNTEVPTMAVSERAADIIKGKNSNLYPGFEFKMSQEINFDWIPKFNATKAFKDFYKFAQSFG